MHIRHDYGRNSFRMKLIASSHGMLSYESLAETCFKKVYDFRIVSIDVILRSKFVFVLLLSLPHAPVI